MLVRVLAIEMMIEFESQVCNKQRLWWWVLALDLGAFEFESIDLAFHQVGC